MENLFVIHPPGCGGHHLANIISTSDRFTKLYDNSMYNTSTVSVHPNKNKNYELTVRDLANIQTQNNVFCTHLAEYLIAQPLTNQYLQNRKYVIIEMPASRRSSFFINRITDLYPAYREQYFLEECAFLYSIQCVSRLFEETDMTNITVDMIFSKDIAPLVDKLNLEFGLNLDINEVSKIHDMWIEKNKKFL